MNEWLLAVSGAVVGALLSQLGGFLLYRRQPTRDEVLSVLVNRLARIVGLPAEVQPDNVNTPFRVVC